MDGRAGPARDAAGAAARVRAAGAGDGRIGVILGTGLGGIVERLEGRVEVPVAVGGEIHCVTPTATGHRGRIVTGSVRGCPVVALQGRVHAYEGFEDEAITRGVRLLAALGVRTLLVTNASGGLRHDMTAGELLVLDDHLDFVRRPSATPRERHPSTGTPYCPRLVALALAAARRAGVRARSGVYARLLGPTYETRAEYRMLLRSGADVAGMSTVPEVLAARRLGLAVVAVSVVTNVANPDDPEETSADEVCRLAATAENGVWAVLAALAEEALRSDDDASPPRDPEIR